MSRIDFSDLDEDLSVEQVKEVADSDAFIGQTSSQIAGAIYETKCTVAQCRNGNWVSYTGRVVGECFKCNGTGIIRTKTNPETLKQNRIKARQKRAEKAANALQSAEQFLADNQDIKAWFQRNHGSFEFATDLYQNLFKYGSLTERQLAAVRKMVAGDAERRAARTEASKVKDLDMSRLVEIFDNASQHLKKPRLVVGDLRFSKAPATGSNAGYLYVKHDGEYAGKISPEGIFQKAYGCDDETVEAIKAISADPLAAAQDHGHETGNCSACGRQLTNELSVELGIGPICRGRWGL